MESILEELLAENAQLREKLGNYQELGFTSNINILSRKPKLKISGVLIAEGVWKGVKYDYDEMKKALSKFLGLPIKVQHGKSEEFGDRTVGKVTKVAADDVIRSLVFEGVITDEKAVKLIEDGVFNAISIKGGFEKLEENSTPPVGRNYTPIEASLTGSPACDNCMIFNVSALEKALNDTHALSLDGEREMVEGEYEDEVQEENKETEKETQAEETVEIKANEVLVLPDNWDEIEDFTIVEAEIKPIDEVLELAKELAKEKEKVKVVKIIKVPPGKYPKVAKKIAKYYGYPYPYYGYPYYYYPYYYYVYPEASEEIEEEEGENMELATVKCPVCGEEFKSKRAFLKHWKEEHEEKYGAYQLVKRLIQKMEEDRSFTRKFKHIIQLEEKETESDQETKETVGDVGQEEKKEESKAEIEEKTEQEKGQEEKKEEEQAQTTVAETTQEEPRPSLEELLERAREEAVREGRIDDLVKLAADFLARSEGRKNA
ncbi:MAG: hypothetical protein DRN15_09040 [Thermoprotei archaeon]|nr:MAG: hypothetical protein DRN15_09040 [Thermoprotei archaeon]